MLLVTITMKLKSLVWEGDQKHINNYLVIITPFVLYI